MLTPGPCLMRIHLVQNSLNATFSQSQKSHCVRTWCNWWKRKSHSNENAPLELVLTHYFAKNFQDSTSGPVRQQM